MFGIVITNIVSIFTFKLVSGKQTYDTVATYIDKSVAIQPAGNDTLMTYPGIPAYQAFDIYVFEPLTLHTGDKFKQGTDEWIVKGVPQVYDLPFIYYQKVAAEKVV